MITGNNFTGATAVLFNGIFCSTFTVNSISQITAIVPLGATTGLVSVQRGICSGVSLGTYTVATNVTLNLKMFIQGYYIGSGLMKPVLLNSGMTIDPQMVDWVTVELHNSLSPNTISGTDTKLLHIDGNIQLNFTSTVLGGCYYIVIKHRNSLTTWSKDPITLTSITNFDLTH